MRPLALALAASAFAAPARAQAPVRLETTRLGPGLFRISGGESGSVMVLTGPDGTLLVDARDTAALALDSAVAAVAAGPVRWVVFTHYHWDHHGRAPQWPGAERIAHANFWAQASKDTTIAELRWERHAAPASVRPTRTVQDSAILRINGEEVLLWHPDSAHTDGDLMVFFRRARVVHTGDVLEREAYPFLDLWAGGTMDGLIRGMDGALARTADGWTWAPGHGTVTDRAGAMAYREMLNDVRARVGVMVAGGSTLSEVADAGITAPWDATNGARGGRRFVQLVALGMRARSAP
jgi:glyoxylase-like metal-dependent hydrolase (beta-lactamase superfamily II)